MFACVYVRVRVLFLTKLTPMVSHRTARVLFVPCTHGGRPYLHRTIQYIHTRQKALYHGQNKKIKITNDESRVGIPRRTLRYLSARLCSHSTLQKQKREREQKKGSSLVVPIAKRRFDASKQPMKAKHLTRMKNVSLRFVRSHIAIFLRDRSTSVEHRRLQMTNSLTKVVNLDSTPRAYIVVLHASTAPSDGFHSRKKHPPQSAVSLKSAVYQIK